MLLNMLLMLLLVMDVMVLGDNGMMILFVDILIKLVILLDVVCVIGDVVKNTITYDDALDGSFYEDLEYGEGFEVVLNLKYDDVELKLIEMV